MSSGSKMASYLIWQEYCNMTGNTFWSVSFLKLVYICILYLKMKINLQQIIILLLQYSHFYTSFSIWVSVCPILKESPCNYAKRRFHMNVAVRLRVDLSMKWYIGHQLVEKKSIFIYNGFNGIERVYAYNQV